MPIEDRDEFFDAEVLEMFPEAFQRAEDVSGQFFGDAEEFDEEDRQRQRELRSRKRRLQPVDFGQVQSGRIRGNPFSVDYSPLTNAILSGAQSVINAERQRRMIGDPEKAQKLEKQAAQKREQAQELAGEEKAIAGETGPAGSDTVETAPTNIKKKRRLEQEAAELEQQAQDERGVLNPLQELSRQRKQARQDEKSQNQFTRQLFQQFAKAGLQERRAEDEFERQKELTEIQAENQRELARLQNNLKQDLVDYEQRAEQGAPPDLSEFRNTVDDITAAQQNVINRLQNQKEDVQKAIQWKNLDEQSRMMQEMRGNKPDIPESLLNKSTGELRKQAEGLQQEISKTGERIDRINKDLYERAARIYGIPQQRAQQIFEGESFGEESEESFEEFDERKSREIGQILNVLNNAEARQGQRRRQRPRQRGSGSTELDTVINDFSTDFN